MSYRSVKRVLGETNLERKCRLLFGACLLFLIAGSFWVYSKQTEKLVFDRNASYCRQLVRTVMAMVHWKKFEENAQYKVMVDGFSTDLSDDVEWSFIKRDGTMFLGLGGATDATGESTVIDDWELDLLDHELTNPIEPVDEREPFHLVPRPDGSTDYVYYEPVRAGSICIDCHRIDAPRQDLFDGDLIAIAKVTMSSDDLQQELALNRAILITTAVITVFLAMIASYVIVRYVIVKPLRHLQEVSDAVSRGDLEQRAEIHTADEFEELAVAFNRMLRHLLEAQDELRYLNRDLDAKVDELAQVNMRLFEMNRVKGDFLATMSHELRTPLNSIIGFSDVLGSIDSLDEKQKRYVQNIQKSGRVLLDMINDILDLAKIESGRMEVRLSCFRIDQLIGAQCDMARPLTEKKNIDLDVDVERGLPEMEQDQGKVQQILNNLLSNAIKFTPEGGRIVVKARRDGSEHVLLTVADTGVGIAEEEQASIFDKFRQGKSAFSDGDAMTREYSGTGLGLSIVKELCKLLGGDVSVESELGKGSRFTVRLLIALPEQPKLASPLAESLEGLTKPRRADYDRPVGSSVTLAD